jgi:hypothetical protein
VDDYEQEHLVSSKSNATLQRPKLAISRTKKVVSGESSEE